MNALLSWVAALTLSAASIPESVKVATPLLQCRDNASVRCQPEGSDISCICSNFFERHSLDDFKIVRVSSSGVTLQSPVRYTPTFVVVDRGREIGRIEGFSSDDQFWGRLDELAAKLAAVAAPQPDRI